MGKLMARVAGIMASMDNRQTWLNKGRAACCGSEAMEGTMRTIARSRGRSNWG